MNVIRPRLAILIVTLVCLVPVCGFTQTDAEKAIEARDLASNGISVGTPKVFDDSILQQMLNAAQARLASLQILDQTGISSRLGSITGASQQITSFGLTVQGPAVPQVATTSNGATKQVVDAVKSPTDSTVTTTTTAPVQNVVTTAPQFNVPTAVAPSPSTSLPTSFSVSASDILNEQLQLTFEIANLRLLLEGALSDRILRYKDTNGVSHENVRTRTTIGFPITVSPDKRFKDAVAIVEVEVTTNPPADFTGGGAEAAPAITALLPREKTYNVAAITDKNVSIGGGLVTQIVGVSGSFFSGRKTYYVVQDQDTLAVTLASEHKDNNDSRRSAFLWQFRPVLGENYVRSGLKQTFVQLSFPSPATADCLGTIHIRTYWRKFDRKTGILKEVVPNSLRDNIPPEAPIPTFDLSQDTTSLNAQSLEDLGNGQMLVKLKGNFLGGTYVRIGSTLLQAGSNGFTSEYSLLRFIAPINDLATKKSFLVARDGKEKELKIKSPLQPSKNVNVVKIKGEPVVTAIDESNSLLSIALEPVSTLPNLPLVLVIGGKVFGYSDAPINRHMDSGKITGLETVLPTAFLIANPEVTVKPLMSDDRLGQGFSDRATLFPPQTELERLVFLDQSSTRARYLLFGRKLGDLRILSPVQVEKPASEADKTKAEQASKYHVQPGYGPRTNLPGYRQAVTNQDAAAGSSGTDTRHTGRTPPPSSTSASMPTHNIELKPLTSESKDTLQLLEMDADLAKALKQVALQRCQNGTCTESPFLIAVPPLPTSDQAKQELKFQERVTVGADEAVIVGDDVNKVADVIFQGKSLDKSLDGKNLKIKGLAAAGVTATAKTQNVDLKMTAGGKTTIKLEVVSSKIETVQK